MKKLKICVGSLNPTKVNAVKIAFNKYFNNIEIYKIKADSKVSDQPIGMKRTIQGAINRAESSLNHLINKKRIREYIFGVGIEAGLAKIPFTKTGYMDFQFCAIVDEKKEVSLGTGIGFEYPQTIIEQVIDKNGAEIGEIIGKLAGNINLKNETGAISFLSKNAITRTEILTQAVICALLPLINRELYK